MENERDKKGRLLRGRIFTAKEKLELSKRRVNEYETGKRKPYNKGGTITEEHKKKVSNALKGRKKQPFTKEHKKTISKGVKELWKNSEYRAMMSKSHIGYKQSKETIEKRVKQFRGKNSPRWKGGITPLVRKVRNCFKYRQWRSDIFTRDDYTCQKCGIRGTEIHADHYPKSFSKIFKDNNLKTFEEALNCEELWNINNGRVLCKSCHLKTKNYGNRKQI